jgi:hypothetical protein
MGVNVELISKAHFAFEDELKCWTRHGTWQPGVTLLRRDPTRAMTPSDIGPDVPEISEMLIEGHQINDSGVHDFLFFRAMEKALEAVQDDITKAAVNAVTEECA